MARLGVTKEEGATIKSGQILNGFGIFLKENYVDVEAVMLTSKLPKMLKSLFWDYAFDALTWEEDYELILSRILTSGNWDAVIWLRSHAGDQSLREWIERHQGKGLSPQQLRFWEIILGLSRRQVNSWLSSKRREIWEKRANR